MELEWTEEEEEFRAGLREWLGAVLPGLPPKPRPRTGRGGGRTTPAGSGCCTTPGTRGCTGRSTRAGGRHPTQQLIFLEETERAGAPYVGANFVGMLHAGPTIAAEGTAGQRARWLPPVLRGEEIWCQGFSEPDAGSDLASLRTRAVRDGDHYVVSGQKIWTSHAEVADWCELLVRTGPGRRSTGDQLARDADGRSGVTVRPLRTLAGSTEFAEMFLDEVRVPVANRIGAENDGWRVTMVTLSFERGTAFVGEVIACRRTLAAVASEARATGRWDDAVLRRRLGRLNAEFRALWRLTQWNVSEAQRSGGVPGVGGSVFKLRYSQARQELYEAAADVLGADALDLDHEWVLDRLSSLSYTIAAGTSQIQRNIVAERILGLPKGR
ncbi:acyl-CoA dehydrogenase family protein [Streptomyces sp. M10(2022)]